jgi:peptidoglycan/xylan/chitin deacetylase (PgdA/CDA1 family)
MIRLPAIKGVAQWALATGGAPAVRAFRRDGVVVLAYHGVVASGESARFGEASLHVTQATFAEHLDELRETHDVVSLAEVLSGSVTRSSRPRAVITFDDAYIGALTLGFQELARRRMPATVFVAPAFLTGRRFWWDDLSAHYGGEMPPSIRETALSELEGDDERIRRWAAALGLTETGSEAVRCATADELHGASQTPGMTFGAHSWSHRVLPRLSREDLVEELKRPLAWLRDHVSHVVRALAVPYAISSEAVEREARMRGYLAVFGARTGFMPGSPVIPFSMPRQNVPAGLSRDAFTLRSAGMRA